MRFFRAAASIVAGCIVFVSGAASGQTPAASPAPLGKTLVRISACSANLHTAADPQGYAPAAYTADTFQDAFNFNYNQPPMSTAPAHLSIAYTNISAKAMTSIQFGLLADNVLVAEARDHGSFAPRATIKHKLGLNLQVMIPGQQRCVPLVITFADGTKWRNPRLPPKGQSLYYNTGPITPQPH
ncbi:MAG: hypothetical protein JOZ38_11535 [Candidatus Eremiobacteraeota bacterium]|nr:hypothetical protein [Candidatus Eremiobacteraeota bacterium]